MTRARLRPLLAPVALCALTSLAACKTDNLGSPSTALSFASALNSTPSGMEYASTSYAAAANDSGMPWGGPRRGGPGGPGAGGMMGGGLDGNFLGQFTPGRGPGRGAFGVRIDSTCVFAASTGDLTCGPNTRNGLTVTTIYSIKTAAGAAQSKIDTTTTNSVRTRTTVSGTTTRSRDGSVTATVNSRSDRTVTGLTAASTERTVNGTSFGTETAAGTNRDGDKFTATRTASDTTVGLVIPVSATAATYPKAGKVTRVMTATTTLDGGTAKSTSRKEVLTYDGTATAKLVITEDGTTKNCTIALPRGRPSCS
ncbi:MAG TPA: hypothetical protein VGE27_01855 [Gemmatimonas sp.]|uniref:hypothetical protein n=1 Tax=Gemmatimonas sp. TaxID=1962908 RepID=UPI002ED8ED24